VQKPSSQQIAWLVLANESNCNQVTTERTKRHC